MIKDYPQDVVCTFLTVALGVLAIPTIGEIVRDEKLAGKSKWLARLALFGLGLLGYGVIGNSLEQGSFSKTLIVAYLQLKITGDWFYRYLLPLAYIMIVVGGVGALVARRRARSAEQVL